MRLLRLAPIALLILAAACGSPQGQSASTPSPATSGTANNSTPTPTPSCATGLVTGGSATGGRVVTARVGTLAGYDRFVVEFNGSVPRYEVRTQDATAFVLSPKGESVRLDGSAGVLIRLEPTLDWTSYTGPADMHPGYQFIREARLVENFEAVQQWGLGVASPACLRVFTLDSPARLVVDVSAAQ